MRKLTSLFILPSCYHSVVTAQEKAQYKKKELYTEDHDKFRFG